MLIVLQLDLLPARDRCHDQVTAEMTSSGSSRVAVSGVPTCGCTDESSTDPASSTLVTVTVISSLLMLLPSDACTVTWYTLFLSESISFSKSGAGSKLSTPPLVIAKYALSVPRSVQETEPPSGSRPLKLATARVPFSAKFVEVAPVITGASFSPITLIVIAMVSSVTASVLPSTFKLSRTDTVTDVAGPALVVQLGLGQDLAGR